MLCLLPAIIVDDQTSFVVMRARMCFSVSMCQCVCASMCVCVCMCVNVFLKYSCVHDVCMCVCARDFVRLRTCVREWHLKSYLKLTRLVKHNNEKNIHLQRVGTEKFACPYLASLSLNRNRPISQLLVILNEYFFQFKV